MAFSPLPRLLLAKDDDTPSPFPSPTSPLRPSIVAIIGVLTTIFSLTFFLLLYAKHCKRHVGSNSSTPYNTTADRRRNSGVVRSVVDSLPVFRFGSLTGQKQGLECAVCLNRFESTELLRLLPKCKHGFHVECVDIWLESHSTCPLCRARVQPEDLLLVLEPGPEPDKCDDEAAPVSLPPPRRVSGRHSSAGENRTRAAQLARRSEGGNGTGVSVGCFERARKDGLLLTESTAEEREEFERRFSHRIIVSGGDATRERWSDLKPSDLLYLRSEMIVTDGGGRVVNSSRSVSEITVVSRFREGEEQTGKRWLGFRPDRTSWWQANGPRT